MQDIEENVNQMSGGFYRALRHFSYLEILRDSSIGAQIFEGTPLEGHYQELWDHLNAFERSLESYGIEVAGE